MVINKEEIFAFLKVMLILYDKNIIKSKGREKDAEDFKGFTGGKR